MTDLRSITRFEVPSEAAQRAESALRVAGARGHECFVLWSGAVQESIFRAKTTHIPDQTGYQLPDGVCVRVEADALHRLNVSLFDLGEELAIQVHTHPTDAYHSATDDSFPIVTQLGALSLVVPDFARRGLLPPDAALYRRSHLGWLQEKIAILQIV